MNGNLSLSDDQWARLLKRIKSGKCTPFIGAGACVGLLPTGNQIAMQWAEEEHYPMEDSSNLVRVAQYLAVRNDPMFPKEELLERWFSKIAYDTLITPQIPHSILAKLPLPIYITTNYDNFMFETLKRQGKNPKRDVCRWNSLLQKQKSAFDDASFEANATNPVVFHLHGMDEIYESLVLTEDDYIDFLIQVSINKEKLLPPRIQQAIAETSLLFIGYSLNDINFRVLFRGIISSVERSLGRGSFTLQLPIQESGAQTYIEKYFDKMDIQVVWGDGLNFTNELLQRWEAFKDVR